MNIKLATVAIYLLASGCAQTGAVKPPAEPDASSPVAGATSRGASSIAMQTSAGSPAGRTRDEVHAEAVQTVRNYRSTMQEDLEYFLTH